MLVLCINVYFRFIEQVKCTLCNKSVKTKCSSTTNMWSHLKNAHPSQYVALKPTKTMNSTTKEKNEVNQQMQRSLSSFYPYDPASMRHKDITDAITRFIVKDLQPVHIVTKPGFQELIRVVDRRYKMPSVNHFKRHTIPALYSQVILLFTIVLYIIHLQFSKDVVI